MARKTLTLKDLVEYVNHYGLQEIYNLKTKFG